MSRSSYESRKGSCIVMMQQTPQINSNKENSETANEGPQSLNLVDILNRCDKCLESTRQAILLNKKVGA
jgi:hypothetical protein